MNFLIIGLGSMGKRRVRCLRALEAKGIFGFDARADRRDEAEGKYGIATFDNLDEAVAASQPAAFIISVPPDHHHTYMWEATRRKIHFFVEASVVDTDLREISAEADKAGIVAAPSATLLFYPAIKRIKEIVAQGHLGKISNIIHHSGQYLPDWHPYESVSDFYVSNPETGGAREIVPFELAWLTNIFGFPKRVSGNVRKTIDISGAEQIDDTYNALLDYGNFLAMLTVDVVSRQATRRLLINGDKRQLVWDWNESTIRVYDPSDAEWKEHAYDSGTAAAGYNKNIGEKMYIDETQCFIDAINGKGDFVNSITDDLNVLELLYKIEESDKRSSILTV